MIDEMGIFRTTVAVAHLALPGERRYLTAVMVDAGSEYNWIPRPPLEELLEGLNVRVDLLQKALVPAGSVPAAAS